MCSFSFFDKLLNKDRVTSIPHLNRLAFYFLSKFDMLVPKYKDMDGEVIVEVL